MTAPPNSFVRDPKTLPGRALLDNMTAQAFARANRDSNIAFFATLGIGVVALWYLRGQWVIPTAIFGLAIRTVLLFYERDGLRMHQMLAWKHHWASADWERETGSVMPGSPEAARLWLASPNSANAPAARRADAMRAAGDLAGSRAVLESAEARNPSEAADLACSTYELHLMEHGNADIAPWRAQIAGLGGEEARYYRVELAFYEAAVELHSGRDGLARLRMASDEDGPFVTPLSRRLVPYLNRYFGVALALGLVGLFSAFVSTARLPF